MESPDLSYFVNSFLGDTEYQCDRIKDGHIHEGWYIHTTHPQFPETILQKVNTHVFPNPAGLMENIHNILNFLQNQSPTQRQLKVIPTQSGQTYYQGLDGCVWRMYEKIENSYTTQITNSLSQVSEAGRMTGLFLKQLKDYPVESLNISIPNFHNTPKRFQDFITALSHSDQTTIQEVQTEIAFLKDRATQLGLFWDALSDQRLPWRVTHNDTKLDNVLFDLNTHQAICLIDLDTIMPGSALFDFGDALRAMGNPVAEDEPDLSKVVFQMPVFEAYTRGYLSSAGDILSPLELSWLALSPWMITIENGLRFLTDYLHGNQYFRIHYPKQNLQRCRTQLKLVADMERQQPLMESIVQNLQKQIV
jgi:thiamine kinase-like enzyme